jgi:hypothetical protein
MWNYKNFWVEDIDGNGRYITNDSHRGIKLNYLIKIVTKIVMI